MNENSKRKKLVVGTLVAITLSSIIPTYHVSADESKKNAGNSATFENSNQAFLSNFVALNDEGNQYYLKDNAENSLTKEQYQYLTSQVNENNMYIKELLNNNSSDDINIVTPAKNESKNKINMLAARAKYKNGVNKVDVHWWGFRVYISKGVIRKIGNGATVGGIWIPHAVVSKVVATLGVGLSVVPGGVRFDIQGFGLLGWKSSPTNVHFQ